jgi:hypothetical protein
VGRAYPTEEPIIVKPMKAFPVIKDLAKDVSWNFRVNKKIPAFQMRTDRPSECVLRAARSRPQGGVYGSRFLVHVAGWRCTRWTMGGGYAYLKPISKGAGAAAFEKAL